MANGSFTEHNANTKKYLQNKQENICRVQNHFIHLHPLLSEEVG